MNQSETDICNIALGWLGEKPITGFSEQSRNAQLCADNYGPIRDAVIEARMWRFAIDRYVSTTADRPGDFPNDPDFPAWGEGFVHRVPTTFLAVFRVYKDVPRGGSLGGGTGSDQAEWQREGDYLLADKPTVYMQGVKSVVDTGKFTSLFVQALAARLAADLCIPITQNRSLQADMWTLYNDKMSEATVRDGQQGRSESTQSRRLSNARSR